MVREIKFRCWNIFAKCMYPSEFFGITLDGKQMVKMPNIGNGEYFIHSSLPKESDLILMQFTGLKDKNGREVFEGDILHWLAIEKKTGRKVVDENVAVIWVEEAARFMVRLGNFDENLFQDRTKHWEVVGNIYENPELLK